MSLSCTPWEALQWKCWEYIISGGTGSLEGAAFRLGRQFVDSAVGKSSGNGSFETRGSETVSDTVMGLNGTLAIAESAQC